MESLKKNIIQPKKTAALRLENGEALWGYGLGCQKAVIGELCFNTSQTGYQEALTDPSYTKQIITFCSPLPLSSIYSEVRDFSVTLWVQPHTHKNLLSKF